MFDLLPPVATDPILGLVMAYKNDCNPAKVDLGAGVYKDAEGNTPIMTAVHEAQLRWLNQENSKSYLSPAGLTGFNEAITHLLLGETHPAVTANRVVCVQTPGGCGALRVGAEMLRRCQERIDIWVSNPTWANHIPLLGSAGLNLREYPYYDTGRHIIDFDAMMDVLKRVSAGDLVLLHGCCHNPSGADLTPEYWRALAALLVEKGAVPFIDIAYQGLGDGLEEDAWGLRYLAEQCPEVIIANSCSKNFGLYRERVGAVVVVAKDTETAVICSQQLQNVARGIYSMPPSHGAALVDIVFHNSDLRDSWDQELAEIRQRIVYLRKKVS